MLTFHVLDEKVKNIELGLIGEDIYNEMAKEVTTYADTVRKGEFPISIAGIKLGSTAKDLDNSQSYFSDKNFEEKVNDDGTVRRKYTDLIVTFENGVIQGLVTHTDKLATGEKIRKGSNVEEVLNAYGDSCSVSKYNGLTLLEYVYDSPKNRTAVLRFAMNGNIVDYISLRIVTADERKNLLSVNKNLRQELEQEKQRQAEAQRQAELQRQQEQERQRQSLGTTVEKFIQNYNDILYIMGQAQEKNLSHLRITGFDKGYDGFKLYMSNCSAYVCGARANGSNLQTIYFLSNDTASMVGQTNFVHVSLAGAYALTYALNNNKSKALYDRLINIFDQRKFPTEFLHEGGLVAGFTNDGSGSAVMFMTEEFYREGYNKFNR